MDMPRAELSEIEALLVRRLEDRRSRRVVFLSHCLLNENTRYLGGATRPGCVRELVDECMRCELGIVQMPCPEEAAWGGVLKRHLLRAYAMGGQGGRPRWVVRAAVRGGLAYTRHVYRRLALRIAAQMEDYAKSGFEVVAAVGVDGSPSCGVQTTIDPSCLQAIATVGPETITVDKQNELVRTHAKSGRGIFIEELQRELDRRGLVVRFVAHDLLAELDGQPQRPDLSDERLR